MAVRTRTGRRRDVTSHTAASEGQTRTCSEEAQVLLCFVSKPSARTATPQTSVVATPWGTKQERDGAKFQEVLAKAAESRG